MKEEYNGFRRLWLDFRMGHGYYLYFALAFANFIVIQYKLLIEQIPSINQFIDNIWIFVLIFVATYIPLAMIIGYAHRKKQIKIEQEAFFQENLVTARLWLFIINLIDDKVTDEEKKEIKEYLAKILKKSKYPSNLEPDGKI